MRFNDILRLTLQHNFSDKPTRDSIKIKVDLVTIQTPAVPIARTYHASCLVGKYMVVSGGEAAVLADLQDMWAFDLELRIWH